MHINPKVKIKLDCGKTISSIAHTHSLNISDKERGADFTQIFRFYMVDGAGVSHSGEQIIEMCEAAG